MASTAYLFFIHHSLLTRFAQIFSANFQNLQFIVIFYETEAVKEDSDGWRWSIVSVERDFIEFKTTVLIQVFRWMSDWWCPSHVFYSQHKSSRYDGCSLVRSWPHFHSAVSCVPDVLGLSEYSMDWLWYNNYVHLVALWNFMEQWPDRWESAVGRVSNESVWLIQTAFSQILILSFWSLELK